MNGFCTTKKQTRFTSIGIWSAALALLGGCQGEMQESLQNEESSVESAAEAFSESPAQLRKVIAREVGGLEKLTVPADDASIPLPPEDRSRPGRYRTTEAKRYLGKMLFHDPIRTARINVNQNVNPPI
jgi:hypothetical protein